MSRRATRPTWSRARSATRVRDRRALIESGREVRTLTHHPDREHPLRARVQASPYRFDDPAALARGLDGSPPSTTRTGSDSSEAGRRSRRQLAALFEAARRAGVARIVHVSIANPSIDSPLPYYRGKHSSSTRWLLPAFHARSSDQRFSSAVGGTSWPTTSPGFCDACRSSSCRTAATWCSHPRRRRRAHLSPSRPRSRRRDHGRRRAGHDVV